MYNKSSYISDSDLAALRDEIKRCPNEDWRDEGLASLRGVRKGGYLINLIKQDHPDRINLVRWLCGEI